MSLNLIRDPWLPVLRRSGPGLIRPAQIAEAHATDPIIAFDWPRADFRIAAHEFLIGLLRTACPPEDEEVWAAWMEAPPSPEALDEAFVPIAHAFDLDGPGPRFLQDMEGLVADSEPVERLLIEAPGDSTVKKNTDLLVRRGIAQRLSRATAAMALYTFQSWAPAGGAGNRTGLRGGGPMITLVLPGADPTLWAVLWANVPTGERPVAADLPRIFPWLAPTITSEGSRTVVPGDNAHPLQCWWGMPRRIRLEFEAKPGVCDLTGQTDEVVVTGWRQRPRGANYAQWGKEHALTPQYRVKPDSEVLPVHPQPGGIGYRHWLGLVANTKDDLRYPAPSVALWRAYRGSRYPAHTRLLVAGFDMDNMKARGFVEAEMPLHRAADREAQEELADRLIGSAQEVANALRQAVRGALFSAGATVKLDAELFATLRERFWAGTEADFYALLGAQAGGAKPDFARWLDSLRNVALQLFDEAAPLDPLSGGTVAQRISQAKRNLVFTLRGYGKAGAALFSLLDMPAPESGKTKAKKGKAA
ncbi:type I-E CRISPR-associated protein Cse1/CasA [Acetobacteraceae bacterium H6797]|nr:type I-E CRISPR-associated protein Cse1/CasA [Acetobacteraceae bacterium H6797]